MTESSTSGSSKNSMDSFGKLIGGILGITLMTMWITVVATFTHDWYAGN